MQWNSMTTTVILVLSLSGGAAWSQETADAASEASAATATASPGADMAALIDGVTNTANDLQNTLDSLTDLVALSNDRERGTEALDRMLSVARDVNERLNRDSDVWRELDALLDVWSGRRDAAAGQIATVPDMAQIAELWQVRVDRGMSLRRNVLDQASMSSTLITTLEARRLVILELYDLGAADQVLANLTTLSEQLETMNNQMTGIAEASGDVFSTGVAQN